MSLQHELAEDERRVEVHRPRAHPAVERIVLDRDVVRQRGVVHQHVHRSVRVARRLDRAARTRPARRCSTATASPRRRPPGSRRPSFQRPSSGWSPSCSVRAAHTTAPALGREQLRDLRADASARARHDHRLAVELAHHASRAMCSCRRITASRDISPTFEPPECCRVCHKTRRLTLGGSASASGTYGSPSDDASACT